MHLDTEEEVEEEEVFFNKPLSNTIYNKIYIGTRCLYMECGKHILV